MMNSFDIGLMIFLKHQEIVDYMNNGLHLTPQRAILLLSRAYGIRVGFFGKDTFYERDGVTYGKACYWDGSRFCSEDAPFPSIMDNVPPLRPRLLDTLPQELYDWVHKTPFLNGSSLSKEKIARLLLTEGYGQYMIPTATVEDFDDIVRQMHLWKKCIIKPANGRKGRCVSFLDVRSDAIYYKNVSGEGVLTKDVWQTLCSSWPQYSVYLLQPRLNFQTLDNHAVDFRLLVSKGGSGDWETVAIYPRIGASTVVSNVSGGGYIGEATAFLEGEYAGHEAALTQELDRLAYVIPRLVEQHCSERVNCFGIDVGIDRDTLQPYVIEVNTFPGVKFHAWQLAEKRVQYYQYLLKQQSAES